MSLADWTYDANISSVFMPVISCNISPWMVSLRLEMSPNAFCSKGAWRTTSVCCLAVLMLVVGVCFHSVSCKGNIPGKKLEMIKFNAIITTKQKPSAASCDMLAALLNSSPIKAYKHLQTLLAALMFFCLIILSTLRNYILRHVKKKKWLSAWYSAKQA